jgi:DNA-nicking Smr family endonuclease
MTRRPRKLTPEERELWQRVAHTAQALHPETVRPTEKPVARPPKKGPAHLTGFQVGEAARHIIPGHDLAPTLPERLAAAPMRMERRMHQQMTRGKLQPEARLDLHGMTLAEAHPELIRFILSSHGKARRLVLVITGKGKNSDDIGPIPQRPGVLRQQVPNWLAAPPLGSLVLQVTPAHQRHGGSGAYYVYLRRGG